MVKKKNWLRNIYERYKFFLYFLIMLGGVISFLTLWSSVNSQYEEYCIRGDRCYIVESNFWGVHYISVDCNTSNYEIKKENVCIG